MMSKSALLPPPRNMSFFSDAEDAEIRKGSGGLMWQATRLFCGNLVEGCPVGLNLSADLLSFLAGTAAMCRQFHTNGETEAPM